MHGGGPEGTKAAQNMGRLAWALGLTATYMVAEVVGGLVTGSLALLADRHLQAGFSEEEVRIMAVENTRRLAGA